MANIAQVARHAGVGIATVSRVINGSPAVREQTRQRVLDAIAELGYAPNPAARALSTGRTLSVGVVAPFFTRPSVMERLRGISHVLAGAGYRMVLFDVERPGQDSELFRSLPGGLDGLLSISLCPPAADLDRFAAAGMPMVLVDHPHECMPSVHTDDVAGGRLATEHLLDLGHERIAFLGDFEHNYHGFTSSASRRAGYEQALAAVGLDVDPELVRRASHGREHAAELTRALLQAQDPPTAIFAASDTQAMGVLEAADDARRERPRRPLGHRLRRHRSCPLHGPDHGRPAARGERRDRREPPAGRTRGCGHNRAAAAGPAGRSRNHRRRGSPSGSMHGPQEGTFLTTPTD